MQPRTQIGVDEWLSQRAALLTAVGMWAAGFALAGASAWRTQHPAAGTLEMDETPTAAAATQDTSCDDPPTDTAEAQGAVFLPGDVVVGRRTPTIGVTEMQKP
jgi:hypothetical protein